jgi:hypothetical protein
VILSALVAHTGWHWTLERASVLSRFHVEWPEWNAVFFANVLRWAMLLTAVGGILWLVRTRTRSGAGSLGKPRPKELVNNEGLVNSKDIL